MLDANERTRCTGRLGEETEALLARARRIKLRIDREPDLAHRPLRVFPPEVEIAFGQEEEAQGGEDHMTFEREIVSDFEMILSVAPGSHRRRLPPDGLRIVDGCFAVALPKQLMGEKQRRQGSQPPTPSGFRHAPAPRAHRVMEEDLHGTPA